MVVQSKCVFPFTRGPILLTHLFTASEATRAHIGIVDLAHEVHFTGKDATKIFKFYWPERNLYWPGHRASGRVKPCLQSVNKIN